jgi:hypothetical protein
MFLCITHNQSGEDMVLRRMGPNESLDLRAHVRKWSDDTFGEFEEPVAPAFSEPGSHIPNGCGEYQAEIRDTKAPTGSCWTSEPFFIVPAEEADTSA